MFILFYIFDKNISKEGFMSSKKSKKDLYDEALIQSEIEAEPFLSVIYQKKGFVEKFHTLDYDNQIKAYQTLVRLASVSNPNNHTRNDAYYRLEKIMPSIGLELIEKQDCFLSKDERLIIRMDFYGSIDRIQAGERKRKLSKPYLDLISKPLKKRSKMVDYDFTTAPMWPLFERFKSFRKIENDLKQYLVKNKINPKILSVMNIRDFSDLIVKTFQTDDSEMKIKFEKPVSVRKRFVMEIAERYGDQISKILQNKGYDERYVYAMIRAMQRFGATKTDKLVITETHFTDRALRELEKHKVDCKNYKIGDEIPQQLIDRLIDDKRGNLIVAYDSEGKRLYGSQFPSFEVHHKHAVSSGGNLSNIASINYKDNLCLVLTDIHMVVLHGMDIIEDNKRDAYSRRTEFIDDDVVFMAGFEKEDKIFHSYINSSAYKKHEKEDCRIYASYEQCLSKLMENQEKYFKLHETAEVAKKDFNVDEVVSKINQTYEIRHGKKPQTRRKYKNRDGLPLSFKPKRTR